MIRKNAEVHMKNIVFIGMPAVGKSTVGVVVAKRLGYEFIDTDLLIQKQEQRLCYRLNGVEVYPDIHQKSYFLHNPTDRILPPHKG